MTNDQCPMTKDYLFKYFLRLGDNSLILGHRLSEWCGHAPILEEDIALTNIALDLIGQSRIMLTNAAEAEGKSRTEDDLAYLRDSMDFFNCLLVEQPNNDYGYTITRQFLFDAYSYHLYESLKKSSHSQLSSYAEKALKETTYHLRHSSEWMIRLGDGTEESHSRVQNALDDLWMFTGDMFEMDASDEALISEGIAVDQNNIRGKWEKTVEELITKATLMKPKTSYMLNGSKRGKHSEHLGFILAEMQFLQRAYPGAKW